MPKFAVNCYWQEHGIVYVDAETPEAAAETAMADSELPKGSFISGSFTAPVEEVRKLAVKEEAVNA